MHESLTIGRFSLKQRSQSYGLYRRVTKELSYRQNKPNVCRIYLNNIFFADVECVLERGY